MQRIATPKDLDGWVLGVLKSLTKSDFVAEYGIIVNNQTAPQHPGRFYARSTGRSSGVSHF